MPAIKYKERTYAGSSFPVLEMTRAEYDALSEAKKMDGTVYMITDGTGSWAAEDSTYDNTESGLTATNVQDALDELSSNWLNKTYPVGSIYLSVVNTSPATFLGGTWELLDAGFVLKTINSGTGGSTTSAGATGAATGNTANSTAFDSGAASGTTANSVAFDSGAASGNTANSTAFDSGAASGNTASHTLTTAEMPSHTHTQNAHSHTLRQRILNGTGTAKAFGFPYSANLYNYTATQGGGLFSIAGNISSLATDQPASVLNVTATNQNTGGGGGHSHGLNSHKHSIGAHSHGLNSHKHSIGAHSHGLNSHTHTAGMPANISVYAWKRTA